MSLSKNRKAALAKVEKDKLYAPVEAMNLVKECSSAKFDETVEVHFRLGIDTRQADQQLRGMVSLPNGSGKTVRVAVFAEGAQADAAREAGADIVGSDDLVADIQAGNINFDAAVATPNLMGKVGRTEPCCEGNGTVPSYPYSATQPRLEPICESYTSS